ncbi:hypothetical protein D1872_216880 [compost metagenome]
MVSCSSSGMNSSGLDFFRHFCFYEQVLSFMTDILRHFLDRMQFLKKIIKRNLNLIQVQNFPLKLNYRDRIEPQFKKVFFNRN